MHSQQTCGHKKPVATPVLDLAAKAREVASRPDTDPLVRAWLLKLAAGDPPPERPRPTR